MCLIIWWWRWVTEEWVWDRTVTKTCIKPPVVTIWDISSDSSLHWIPCHSSLNGQIDEFMHNWGLYYEKENERSVFSLTVKGEWVGDKRRWKEVKGGGQLLPWSRKRDGGDERMGVGGRQRVWCTEVESEDSYLHLTGGAQLDVLTQPSYTLSTPHHFHWGRAAMSSGDCKWIKPSGLRGKLIYSLSRAHSSERSSKVLHNSHEGWEKRTEFWEEEGKVWLQGGKDQRPVKSL